MPKLVQLLGTPVILSLAVPLALFASVTTTLALSALIFRASIVYFELGFALLQSWIFSSSPKSAVAGRRRSSPSSPASDKIRRRSQSRHGGTSGGQTPTRSESFAALGGIGPNRDFEGLGGWRFAVNARDDETWTGMNSRLELPTGGTPSAAGHRRHRRTLSSQSHLGSMAPDSFKMSPVTSSARTPQAVDMAQEGVEYFTSQDRGSESADAADDIIPMSPEEHAARVRMDRRRRSLSIASNASSGESSKSAKSVAVI